MPVFGSIKHKDLVSVLKQAGFDGTHAGGKHEFMVRENLR
jgi:predicted RNA binding protein YcfA (HicA-like mRNA interferase family)